MERVRIPEDARETTPSTGRSAPSHVERTAGFKGSGFLKQSRLQIPPEKRETPSYAGHHRE
jgi:hypothetical protein